MAYAKAIDLFVCLHRVILFMVVWVALSGCGLFGDSTNVDLDDETPPVVAIIGSNIVSLGDDWRIDHEEHARIRDVRSSFLLAVQADDEDGVKTLEVEGYDINVVCVSDDGSIVRTLPINGPEQFWYEDTDLSSARSRLTHIIRVFLGKPEYREVCSSFGAQPREISATIRANASNFGDLFAEPAVGTFYKELDIVPEPEPPEPDPDPPDDECIAGAACMYTPGSCQPGFQIEGEFVCVNGEQECRGFDNSYCGPGGLAANCGLPSHTSGCSGDTACNPWSHCNPQPDLPTRSFCEADLTCSTQLPVCYRPGDQISDRSRLRALKGC